MISPIKLQTSWSYFITKFAFSTLLLSDLKCWSFYAWLIYNLSFLIAPHYNFITWFYGGCNFSFVDEVLLTLWFSFSFSYSSFHRMIDIVLFICSFHFKNGHNKYKRCWTQKNLGTLHLGTRISRVQLIITQRYVHFAFRPFTELFIKTRMVVHFGSTLSILPSVSMNLRLRSLYLSCMVKKKFNSFYFFLWEKQLVVMMSAPSATVFARRALSYLMIGQAELALRDAMQAQVCIPEWPTAFYLQALALSKLGMETDAQDMLNDGATFEAKRQNSWRNWSINPVTCTVFWVLHL